MSGMMGLNIGVRALRAQQQALDVTAHNIANANTKGYSRQRADLVATDPFTWPSMHSRASAGQMGTGVEVAEIERMRNAFVDIRYRDESSILGEWQSRSDALHEIEMIFGEPSESGLRNALGNFWSSLQNLHNSAGDGGVRATVRQSAAALTDLFNSLQGQLQDYQKALDGYVENKVSEVNAAAVRIADLNQQITQIVGKGENPNDLLDKRDLLIDQLSELVNIQVQTDSRSKVSVSIGGLSLVAGDETNLLTTKENHKKNGLSDVVWVSTEKPIIVEGGELNGLLKARDGIVQKYMDELDTMARTFVQEFNVIHQSGYGLDGSTNIQFFVGVNASDIRVNDVIMDEENGLNKIAAAVSIDPVTGRADTGDGGNALKLSQVMQVGVMSEETTTMADYWGGIISELGIDAQRSLRMVENETTLREQLEQRRQSVSGVNLDEEFGNVIKYQHAYNAAAKIIKTQSEMLDTLVNGILR